MKRRFSEEACMSGAQSFGAHRSPRATMIPYSVRESNTEAAASGTNATWALDGILDSRERVRPQSEIKYQSSLTEKGCLSLQCPGLRSRSFAKPS